MLTNLHPASASVARRGSVFFSCVIIRASEKIGADSLFDTLRHSVHLKFLIIWTRLHVGNLSCV
jgi:hypothetical protein